MSSQTLKFVVPPRLMELWHIPFEKAGYTVRQFDGSKLDGRRVFFGAIPNRGGAVDAHGLRTVVEFIPGANNNQHTECGIWRDIFSLQEVLANLDDASSDETFQEWRRRSDRLYVTVQRSLVASAGAGSCQPTKSLFRVPLDTLRSPESKLIPPSMHQSWRQHVPDHLTLPQDAAYPRWCVAIGRRQVALSTGPAVDIGNGNESCYLALSYKGFAWQPTFRRGVHECERFLSERYGAPVFSI